MFSIVIPLYNKEVTISQTIKSALSQKFQDFELLIIDDGSTDNSIDVVKSFKDKRIRLIEQTNSGVSVARNKGVSEAKYELVAFLDADDLWDNDFLNETLELYNRNQMCDVFALNYRILQANNEVHFPILKGLEIFLQDEVITDYFKIVSQSDPLICSSSVTIKKKALENIGGFPVGIRAGEDLLTWAKLAVYFDIAYSKEKKATFNRLMDEGKDSIREPDSSNYVGNELRGLLKNIDQTKIDGLKSYIAFWHKIRLANFLGLMNYSSARKEFQLMSEYAKKDLKYYIYATLVYMPKPLTTIFYAMTKHLNSYRRKILSNQDTQ